MLDAAGAHRRAALRRACACRTGFRSAVAHVEAPLARLLRRAPRVSLEAVRMSRKKMFFDAGKAVRELGLPQSPIETALARAVAWFRAQGYVPS